MLSVIFREYNLDGCYALRLAAFFIHKHYGSSVAKSLSDSMMKFLCQANFQDARTYRLDNSFEILTRIDSPSKSP